MLLSAIKSSRSSLIKSIPSVKFSTSTSSREHFLGATPEMFDKIVKQGDDRVVLVDFYAE
jgi:thiol:disulfide interchange protein